MEVRTAVFYHYEMKLFIIYKKNTTNVLYLLCGAVSGLQGAQCGKESATVNQLVSTKTKHL